MSGTGLRWEAERDGDGRVWRWSAHSGELFVGDAWMSNPPDRPGRWRWQCPLFCGGCDLDAESGEADTPEAARAAAEAAWGRWRRVAGLVPAGEADGWRDIATAPDGPLMLFSPGAGENVPGGVVWVSGGWRYADRAGGFRGDGLHGEPSHWRPLPKPPGDAP